MTHEVPRQRHCMKPWTMCLPRPPQRTSRAVSPRHHAAGRIPRTTPTWPHASVGEHTGGAGSGTLARDSRGDAGENAPESFTAPVYVAVGTRSHAGFRAIAEALVSLFPHASLEGMKGPAILRFTRSMLAGWPRHCALWAHEKMSHRTGEP